MSTTYAMHGIMIVGHNIEIVGHSHMVLGIHQIGFLTFARKLASTPLGHVMRGDGN